MYHRTADGKPAPGPLYWFAGLLMARDTGDDEAYDQARRRLRELGWVVTRPTRRDRRECQDCAS